MSSYEHYRWRTSINRSRLLYTTTGIVLFIICLASFSLTGSRHSNIRRQADFEIFKKSSCRHIHKAKDQCAFYEAHCTDLDGQLFSYLSLYYCRLRSVQPVAVALQLGFLVVLFTGLGTVAGDFFSVNLSSIARGLRMNDTLAGVTFLALGNGSPDIFSTFAAMKEQSSSMAVGELVGAASFITAVVAGSMALVKPFDVVRASLVRDVFFLVATVLFLTLVLVQGQLRLWHCITMLGTYVFYVCLIMFWHWWLWKHPSQADPEDAPASLDTRVIQDSIESTPLLATARPVNRMHSQSSAMRLVNPDKIDDDESQSLPGEIYRVLFPTLQNFQRLNIFGKAAAIWMVPIIFIIKITLPVVREQDDGPHDSAGDPKPWHRWLLILQSFMAPQFMLAVMWFNEVIDKDDFLFPTLGCLAGSAIITVLILVSTTREERPAWFESLSAVGFIISIAWISTIADEVVSVLKALGIIMDISEGILGITVFAIGNSIEDLAANISVAQHGHPIMALSACFGGPLLNILLGISVSGIYLIARNSSKGDYSWSVHLHATKSLYITIGILLVTMVVLLSCMLWTKWRMTKPVGFILLGIWCAGTIVNVVVKTLYR